jgi:hypothetical protein
VGHARGVATGKTQEHERWRGEGLFCWDYGWWALGYLGRLFAVFSFLYFLKIKISKIYVRFQIFQKYTPVALP